MKKTSSPAHRSGWKRLQALQRIERGRTVGGSKKIFIVAIVREWLWLL
jgi:hypothetical protein